jgi:peptide/nickel transport system substrate-binding protein
VRQAFISCIDRLWIAQSLFFGMVTPAWGPLASSAPEYWTGVRNYYPFNLKAAAKLLDEAGWHKGPDGIRIKGTTRLSIYLPILLEPRIGVVLQAYALKAGFDLRIEQVTHERQEELIFANAYDLLSLHWNLNDASVLDVPFRSTNVPGPGRFSFNWSRYQDSTLDDLLTQAAASTGATRNQLYGRVQQIVMDQALFLPIHENAYNVVYSNRIDGLRLAHGNAQTLLAAATSAA